MKNLSNISGRNRMRSTILRISLILNRIFSLIDWSVLFKSLIITYCKIILGKLMRKKIWFLLIKKLFNSRKILLRWLSSNLGPIFFQESRSWICHFLLKFLIISLFWKDLQLDLDMLRSFLFQLLKLKI